ncbi:Fe-S cluster assembly protein IscX [Shewanella sp. DC2-4]|uniref:Fe-S cluster assembly protein IscX n=1 Tax=Shewanella sp. DC2-4 TaxID=2739431 RepID=UPI001566027C|nr:Fe-S cluster assembly protein IscX [Shewanella sp. DC2-4]NRD31858.1 Fe-S cluster assembly protein IscX [Shewanella sp. DC2-4]
MTLTWIDSLDIALELLEAHPEVNPTQLYFTQLYEWVLALNDFADDPKHCNEKILEAIQQCWIDEK